jgi:hypothetical protein
MFATFFAKLWSFQLSAFFKRPWMTELRRKRKLMENTLLSPTIRRRPAMTDFFIRIHYNYPYDAYDLLRPLTMLALHSINYLQ